MEATIPASRLGRYLLQERIASGGMAEVYRGSLVGPSGFQKDVAIKRIRRDVVSGQLAARLVREAKVAVALQHPCIVQVLELGEENGEPFIVMELVRGRDLSTVLERASDRGTTLPLPIVLHVAAEICRGLEYAHTLRSPEGKALGLVHRDIKPGNVMLGLDGSVKILDFGIAQATAGLRKDGAKLVVGSLSYMSPEQLRGDGLDLRSDLHAFGLVLYEMLTGEAVYTGTERMEVASKILDTRYEDLAKVRPDLPAELYTLVRRCLTRAREERPASAAEALATVRRVQLAMSTAGPEDVERLLHDLLGDEPAQARPVAAITRTFETHTMSRPPELAAAAKPKNAASASAHAQSASLALPTSRTPKLVAVGLLVAGVAAMAGWAALQSSSRDDRRAPHAPAARPRAAPPRAAPAQPRAIARPAPAAPAPAPAAASALVEVPAAVSVGSKIASSLRGRDVHRTRVSPAPGGPSPATDDNVGPPGFLRLTSEPWGNVSIDGRALGRPTPILDLQLSPGRHRIEVINPVAGVAARADVVIRSGETAFRSLTLSAPDR